MDTLTTLLVAACVGVASFAGGMMYERDQTEKMITTALTQSFCADVAAKPGKRPGINKACAE